MEPDDFNEKCIEPDGFVAIEMFELELTDIGHDNELPLFETIGLEDATDKCIENEDGEACGINIFELALLDVDGKIESDDFNGKCIELDEFPAMEMFDLEVTDLGDDDEFPVFEATGWEDVNDRRILFENEGTCGINGVEGAVIDSDAKMEPDGFNEKCIEPDDFVAMEMFDLESTDLSHNDKLILFETIGLKDVTDKRNKNEDDRACDIKSDEIGLLDADGGIEPVDFCDKCIELDELTVMEMFDFEKSDLGDDEELPVFETIGLDDVNDRRITNEDEEAYDINNVEAAIIDSDAKMEPDDFNEKCIVPDDFVATEMFKLESTDIDHDNEFPLFETIGMEDVTDKCIENEDGEACDINAVELALLDVDGKIEPDDFNGKCIELDEFPAMEMFDLEVTDLGDDDEFPVFEATGWEDVNDRRILFENEGTCGINGVEGAVIDSDAKMEPDGFNEKCIEPDDFVAMEMFDLESTDLSHNDKLILFETIGLKDVTDKRNKNEDDRACDIKSDEIGLLDADGGIETVDFCDKCIELDELTAMEMFDFEKSDLGDDDEVPVFETIGLEDVNDRRIVNEDEGAYDINDVEAAVNDSDVKMEPDDLNEKYIELADFVAMGMFDIERTDLDDDDKLPLFETVGLECVNDRRIANEDEGI